MAKETLKDVEALGTVLAALKDLDKNQQKWVLSSAIANLGLQEVGLPTPTQLKANLGSIPPSALQNNLISVSPKEFLHIKNPKSDVQRIACLAFYLTHVRDLSHFKTNDLTMLNVEAAAPRLSNPSVAVNNATIQSTYLAPAGSGSKQITALGEEVVNALPDQEAVKIIEEKQRLKKRKATKKKPVIKSKS